MDSSWLSVVHDIVSEMLRFKQLERVDGCDVDVDVSDIVLETQRHPMRVLTKRR